MDLFEMGGAWDDRSVAAYETFVTPRLAPLYGQLAVEIVARAGRGRLLEVGCGAGRLAAELTRGPAALDLVGLDLSRAMLRRARLAAPAALLVQADATRLPFAAGSFAAAVSVASIKHWPDPEAGLAELARVLAPGGLLGVLEVDRACSWRAARAFVRRWVVPPGPPGWLATAYFRRFVAGGSLDAGELIAACRAAGLVQVTVEHAAGLPFLVARGRRPR